MRVAGLRIRGPALAYVLLEDALLVLALIGGVVLASAGGTLRPLAATALVASTLLVLKLVFLGTGLYEFRRFPRAIDFWRDLAVGLLIFALCAWVALCAIWSVDANRYFLFVGTFIPGVLLGRLAFAGLVRFAPFKRRVLFVGHAEQGRRTAQALSEHPEWMHEVVGFVSAEARPSDAVGESIDGHPLLGGSQDLERLVHSERVDEVVVALEDRRRAFPIDELLRIRLSGVSVIEEARLHEEITGRIPVDDLRPSSLIFAEGFQRGPLAMAAKRAFDVLLALVGLILVTPFALLTALAVRLDSPGPIFYGQKRVGLGGREFTLWKFRSMRQDAEADGKPRFASKNDARVTKVGAFLRKSRLDEVPQMWNVLRGDMSFVGPRPERRYFVDQLKKSVPFYDLRHMVKPGITGWAQVRYSYGAGELDALRKLRYDMYYIKHQSLLLDLRILCDTVGVMIDGELGR